MDETALEQIYQENLEEDIISYLAKEKNISLEDAMNEYYASKLADQISRGENGIQYLDHKVLAQMLIKKAVDG